LYVFFLLNFLFFALRYMKYGHEDC
jgi:hypothetical protein